jgi:hypothetical protein
MPALTRTACKTRIRTMLNEPTIARFFTEANLNDWINDAVRDISIKTFCNQAIGTPISTVSGSAVLSFPTTLNTTNIATLFVKTLVDSNRVSMEYVPIDMLGRVDTNTVKFSVWQEQIIINPIPTAIVSYTPYLILEARQTAAGDLNLPNPYHHLVVWYGVAMGREKRRDMESAASWFTAYNAELSRIYDAITGIYSPTDDRGRLKDQPPVD